MTNGAREDRDSKGNEDQCDVVDKWGTCCVPSIHPRCNVPHLLADGDQLSLGLSRQLAHAKQILVDLCVSQLRIVDIVLGPIDEIPINLLQSLRHDNRHTSFRS